jgi:hypothetical protein
VSKSIVEKKAFKGVEMTTAKWTINTREQQDLHHSAARFNEKGCLWVWGGDALRCLKRGIRGGALDLEF